MVLIYSINLGGGGGGSGGSGPFVASGQATLSGGTVTVTNALIKSTSTIFTSARTPGGVQGILSIGTITNGVSFVINSTSDTETSVVSWGFL